MTATPHNGKEEDFQLFMRLLDSDRFEGNFRPGVHAVDASDMMRRMVKEAAVASSTKRRCFLSARRTPSTISSATKKRRFTRKSPSMSAKSSIGPRPSKIMAGRAPSALRSTILQRRLASSPEAIYQSLASTPRTARRPLREEVKLLKRGEGAKLEFASGLPMLESDDDIEDFEDRPGDGVRGRRRRYRDQATAAQTIAELELEIDRSAASLKQLAGRVRNSGNDRKWEQLSSLLQENEHMFDEYGNRRKLVIFTEHRDTLNYLCRSHHTRCSVFRKPSSRSAGECSESNAKDAQDRFTHDKDTLVLIATDAAGEGINLQQAHLMVNYDLPWNPNRLEQRFGRIHRIGQTNVCHLWNLVAGETREGDVFRRLLEKLEVERDALGGAVFDVLGKAIEGRRLRDLLQEAILYGNQPEVRARLKEKVEGALDHARLRELIEDRSLEHETMDTSRVREIRATMERANARRLQPYFIAVVLPRRVCAPGRKASRTGEQAVRNHARAGRHSQSRSPNRHTE